MVTPSLVTPLIDDRLSKEEFLTKVVGNVSEQQEHISNSVSKQERVFHSEREKACERRYIATKEVSESEKRLKERRDDLFT